MVVDMAQFETGELRKIVLVLRQKLVVSIRTQTVKLHKFSNTSNIVW